MAGKEGFAEEEVATAGVGEGWVEMPEHHIRWILAQELDTQPPIPDPDDYPVTVEGFSKEEMDHKREMHRVSCALRKAEQDDFFRYQAWIRDKYSRNGRVMVPAHAAPPKPEMQEEVDKLWKETMEEYAREHPEFSVEDEEESEAMVDGLPSN